MAEAPYSRSAEVYDAFYTAMLDYGELALRAHGMIQARKPGARRLLEAACGTGLYLEEMSQWYEVAGLDASPEMLDVARARLPGVPVHLGDMAAFDLGERFDAVLCMFSSIGYVVTPERLRSAVRCFAKHLVPGGVLVLEPWYPPEGWRDGHVAAESVTANGIAVSRSSSSVRDGAIATMVWGFAVARPGGDVETYVEEHRTGLFTRAEYDDALRNAGFVYDYDPDGLLGRGRYIAVKAAVV
jgi:SAM-dependent methyltransferase